MLTKPMLRVKKCAYAIAKTRECLATSQRQLLYPQPDNINMLLVLLG